MLEMTTISMGRFPISSATHKIGRQAIELSSNITNDKISLTPKPAIQQNILHKYAIKQTSLRAISSFSNSPDSKRYSC